MNRKICLSFIMAMVLTVVCVSTALAVNGSASSAGVFYVHASNGNASIKLKSTMGVAYVEKHALWNASQIKGYEYEDTHGFYTVTVTGPGTNKTFRWVPSVSGAIDLLNSGFESSATLQIYFPYAGDYTVFVEPMDNQYASSEYWLVDRLLSWVTPATWSVIQQNECFASASAPQQPSAAGTVYIYCYNEYGNEIGRFSQTIEKSAYITPPTLQGYTALSDGVYVFLNTSTGSCDPAALHFYYTLSGSAAIPQFPITGYSVWLKDPTVERIRPQCGPGRQYAVFASMNGSTKLYNPRDITYLNVHFCVGNWAYIEFGYTDNAVRYGFFDRALFYTSVDWANIPAYSLDAERHGIITAAVTPNNGPTSNSGSFASCKLYPGDAVHACMEYNGWCLCRFDNRHTNNYGQVYLWVPEKYISWN